MSFHKDLNEGAEAAVEISNERFQVLVEAYSQFENGR
jgi:hypothetical protein